jgi:hypothetical protein
LREKGEERGKRGSREKEGRVELETCKMKKQKHYKIERERRGERKEGREKGGERERRGERAEERREK